MYKQKVVPEILTSSATFKNLSRQRLKFFCNEFYRKHIKGTSVVNLSTGYLINFTESGNKKVTHGGSLYPKKAMLLIKLREIMKYAEFNNYGEPKDDNVERVLCYLNFKGKCKIDGVIQHLRISCKVYKNGKIFYNHEVNIKK